MPFAAPPTDGGFEAPSGPTCVKWFLGICLYFRSLGKDLDVSPLYPNASGAVKVGVYVDVPDISSNGGRGMRFDTLRRFACRGGAEVLHLNAYVSYDQERAEEDRRYRDGTVDFYRILRDFGYKVVTKRVRWFTDEDGTEFPKSNVDMELAVDLVQQASKLDRVLLLTGDGDFARLVHDVQRQGTRVEVMGFKGISERLRLAADQFTSGYLIPGLLPVQSSTGVAWGEVESRVRGICYDFRVDRGFGFLRFVKNIEGAMWITDTRLEGSAYDTAFVHASELEKAKVEIESLPSRDIVLEFDLAMGKKEGFEARNITLAHRYASYEL